MTKCTTALTLFASFAHDGSTANLEWIRALAGDDEAFVCRSFQEVIDHHLDPANRSSLSKSIRGMLAAVDGDVSKLPHKTAVRAIVEFLRTYEQRHGITIIHAFIADMISSPYHVAAAVEAFPNVELAVNGHMHGQQKTEAQQTLCEAIDCFIAMKGGVIELSSNDSRERRLTAFLSQTILQPMIAKSWADFCSDTAHPIHKLLHRSTRSGIQQSIPVMSHSASSAAEMVETALTATDAAELHSNSIALALSGS